MPAIGPNPNLMSPIPTPQMAQDSLRKQQAHKAAQEFEAVFIAEMLRPVFQEISEQSTFGGGAGEQVMGPMLTDAYGEAIAQAGGIGIADTIYAELLSLQGLKP